MSIRCVCKNGHVLKIKESQAGTTGLCPLCKVRVDVPRLQKTSMSEDAILDLLGREPSPPRVDTSSSGIMLIPSDSGVYGQAKPQKACNRCNREVPAGTHICPYCRTYIANVNDF